MRVRAESRDRSFSIEMGVGGAILGVNLSERAMERSPQALSAALVETINDGMRQIAEITNEVVAPYLSGADLDLAAITSGRLPKPTGERSMNEFADEIEAASKIPKRPMGSYARNRPAADYTREEDGDG